MYLANSDEPVFLVWPETTENDGFWMLDVDRDHYHNLWWMPAASTGASTSSGATYYWLLRLMTTWYRTTRYLLKGESVAFGSSRLGSNPRGQVVVVSCPSHHVSVVPW